MFFIKQMILLVFLALLWANSSKAQSYTPPSYNSKKFKSRSVSVQSAEWDSDARFKVEDDASPERDLASGEDDDETEDIPVRTPSSNNQVKKEVKAEKKKEHKPEMWKYDPKEEDEE